VLRAPPALGALVVAILVLALYVEHRSALELPAPTGPWAVGRLVSVWTDASRTDPFAPGPGQPRELLVWIWYPAAASAEAERIERAYGAVVEMLRRRRRVPTLEVDAAAGLAGAAERIVEAAAAARLAAASPEKGTNQGVMPAPGAGDPTSDELQSCKNEHRT